MYSPIWRGLCALGAGAALAAAGLAGVSGAAAAHAARSPADGTATSSWTITKTVRGANTPHFTAVTAAGRHGAWAFEATSAAPAAWRLSGSHWARAPFRGRPGEQVTAAASTSARDVWAVESSFSRSRSRVLRWDGTRWAVTGRFTTVLDDVVPLSRRDAWVFAQGGGAWHFNGSRWSPVRSGHGLYDGSALSPASIWAIGSTHVAHWNGHTWSRISVKNLLPAKMQLNSPALTAIFAQSPTSVWATGSGYRESIGGPDVVLHFNGRSWHRVAMRSDIPGNPARTQLIPDGTGGLWAPIPFLPTSSTMLHYTGGHLRSVKLPIPAGMALDVVAVAAVPAGQAIAVGGAWPANGPIGGYTRAVILTHAR
jgi:hypothetical protein